MRIANTDYWSVRTEDEWREAIDANALEKSTWSVIAEGQPWGEFEGVGLYHVERLIDSLCRCGIASSKLSCEDIRDLIDDTRELLAALCAHYIT